jgi:hypothetical protein
VGRIDGRGRRYHLGIIGGPQENKPTPTDPRAPLSTLRGAGVAVDPRRAGRVIAAVSVAALVTVGIVLLVAGVDKNSQINELRAHGVPTTVTVTRCVALLGGSGSNGAGYACNGTYTFRRRHYVEAIPGDVNRPPGSAVPAIISPSDPGLVSTAADVRDQRASWRVFIAPGIVLLVAAGIIALLTLRSGRGRSTLGWTRDHRSGRSARPDRV